MLCPVRPHVCPEGQSPLRVHVTAHAPRVDVTATPPSGGNDRDVNSEQAPRGFSARHAASPVAPSAQPVTHRPLRQMPVAQSAPELHADPVGLPVEGMMHRRHERAPPLQEAPKPQTRPEGQEPVVEHSSISGVNASQRIVPVLQTLLPEQTRALQQG